MSPLPPPLSPATARDRGSLACLPSPRVVAGRRPEVIVIAHERDPRIAQIVKAQQQERMREAAAAAAKAARSGESADASASPRSPGSGPDRLPPTNRPLSGARRDSGAGQRSPSLAATIMAAAKSRSGAPGPAPRARPPRPAKQNEGSAEPFENDMDGGY